MSIGGEWGVRVYLATGAIDPKNEGPLLRVTVGASFAHAHAWRGLAVLAVRLLDPQASLVNVNQALPGSSNHTSGKLVFQKRCRLWRFAGVIA